MPISSKSSIEEIADFVSSDMRYNELNVLEKQMALPSTKQTMVAFLFEAKRNRVLKIREREVLIRRTTDKFNETSSVKVGAKTVESRLVGMKDETLKALNEEIEYLETKIEYMTEVVRIYNSATYDIKNIVQLMDMNARV